MRADATMSFDVLKATMVLVLSLLAFYKVAVIADQGSMQSYTLVDKPPLVDLAEDKIALLTLGFPQIYHQFLNFWAVQFLGDQNIAQEAPEKVFKVLKSITKHQPEIPNLYQLSCYTFLLDFDQPDLCLSILIDGMRAVPQDWVTPLLAALVYQSNKNDIHNAAIFFQAAASRKGVPDYVIRLAQLKTDEANRSLPPIPQNLSGFDEFFNDESKIPVGNKLQKYFNKKIEENNRALEPQP